MRRDEYSICLFNTYKYPYQKFNRFEKLLKKINSNLKLSYYLLEGSRYLILVTYEKGYYSYLFSNKEINPFDKDFNCHLCKYFYLVSNIFYKLSRLEGYEYNYIKDLENKCENIKEYKIE